MRNKETAQIGTAQLKLRKQELRKPELRNQTVPSTSTSTSFVENVFEVFVLATILNIKPATMIR